MPPAAPEKKLERDERLFLAGIVERHLVFYQRLAATPDPSKLTLAKVAWFKQLLEKLTN